MSSASGWHWIVLHILTEVWKSGHMNSGSSLIFGSLGSTQWVMHNFLIWELIRLGSPGLRIPQYLLSPFIMLTSGAWVNSPLHTEDEQFSPCATWRDQVWWLNTGTSVICETLGYPGQLHANDNWGLRKTMSFWSNWWRPGKIPWGTWSNTKLTGWH